MTTVEKSINNTKLPVNTIIKEMEPMKETKVSIDLPVLFIAIAIILLGTVSGYLISRGKFSGKTGSQITSGKNSEGLSKVVGTKCEQEGEVPEGILKEGGTDGEGTHHLERDGGEARTVYLTSSVISLSDYEGKKVRLCGETFQAESSGWFMDVLKLELME